LPVELLEFTTMVTVLDELNAPSEAVSCKTYVPEVEKLAVVDRALPLPNVTVPGPLDFDQVVVSVPDGKPSSLAEPLKAAEAGSVIAWLEPALTVGG